MSERTVVVGGGLAGIAAALRLAEAGREVTLLEGRPRLGGAAFSFRRGELTIDNGQHVFLRCCAAYRWLLERISGTSSTLLQPHLDIPVLAADGRVAHLRRTPHVPAPAHLTAALATYGVLGAADRLRATRAALALRMLDPADPALDQHSLGAFLRRNGQSEALIERLWGIVATATLNLAPDDASLALAAKVFRTGLLDHAGAADVGYATVPLGELHGTRARAALERHGVEVLVNHRVEQLSAGNVLRVRSRRGVQQLASDGVVLAVPPRVLFDLAPALRGTAAGRAEQLGTAPIVNVHVVYNRAVTDLPFAAAVDSPVQWVFDRTASSGVARTIPGAQYLAVTVSAADAIVDVASKELTAQFTQALARLLPAARRATVLDAFVTRERHATFRQQVGSAALRPTPDPGLDGVRLAGAWTATGWPDTMEGAVRSGVAAAQSLLGQHAPAHLGFAA
ncbi:hydroxysqualene dehydroxylase HpnE [uncultured Jatrophihabitans sp.]|uniref:hydroxysqualene dehydroxylase HpnE n=1 Tax=uncultured Jatrophihabitans sp. TaxID=1610747 RepID=UPI0035C9667C